MVPARRFWEIFGQISLEPLPAKRYNTPEMSKMSKAEKFFLWVFAIYLLFTLARVLAFSETAYQEDTRRYHLRLPDILRETDEFKKRDALHELAIEVGAGAEHTVQGTPYRVDEHLTVKPYTIISESEIVNNINIALQTRSNLSTQEQARKSNLIAFFAVFISLGALLVSFRVKKQSHRSDSP